MKLDDLSRPSARWRLVQQITWLGIMLAVTLAGYVEWKNVSLIEANLTLVRLMEQQLTVTEARVATLESVQVQVRQALHAGSVNLADSILRTAVEE